MEHAPDSESVFEVSNGDRIIAVYLGDTASHAWLSLCRLVLNNPELSLDTLTSDHVDAALDKLRDAGNTVTLKEWMGI